MQIGHIVWLCTENFKYRICICMPYSSPSSPCLVLYFSAWLSIYFAVCLIDFLYVTVCPISLHQIFMVTVSYCIKWAKSSLTDSLISSLYCLLLRFYGLFVLVVNKTQLSMFLSIIRDIIIIFKIKVQWKR